MDNGFSLTGTGYRYCRKGGSDANSGATTALPKATIQSLTNLAQTNNVILAGVYREDVSFQQATNYFADGLVVIEGVNPSASLMSTTGNNGTTNYDINYRNYAAIRATGISPSSHIRCTFNTITDFWGLHTTNSVFINCNKTTITLSNQHTRPIFKNCNIALGGSTDWVRQSYVHSDCVITINATSLTNFRTNFLQNCFTGIVYHLGVGYVVPQAVDLTGGGTGVVAFGSRTGTYPAGAADWIHNLFSITPTVCYITNGNFNADPLFRDINNNDFTVSVSSPLIGKISGQIGRDANIGFVQVVTSMLDLTAWNLNNITNTLGELTITSGNSAALTSPPITINSTVARAIGEFNLNGTFAFDASQSAGTVDRNENVPVIKSYKKQGVTITNTSPRPCLKMRLSTANSTPTSLNTTIVTYSGNATVDCANTSLVAVGMEIYGDGIPFGTTVLSLVTNTSITLSANCTKSVTTTAMLMVASEWDNNSYTGLDAGDFFIVELKKQPRIDQNGYGNASNDFDIVNNGFPMGKYVHFVIELWSGTTNG